MGRIQINQSINQSISQQQIYAPTMAQVQTSQSMNQRPLDAFTGGRGDSSGAQPSSSAAQGQLPQSEAPAFLLVHGFGAFGEQWRGQIKALTAAGYQACVSVCVWLSLCSTTVVMNKQVATRPHVVTDVLLTVTASSVSPIAVMLSVCVKLPP